MMGLEQIKKKIEQMAECEWNEKGWIVTFPDNTKQFFSIDLMVEAITRRIHEADYTFFHAMSEAVEVEAAGKSAGQLFDITLALYKAYKDLGLYEMSKEERAEFINAPDPEIWLVEWSERKEKVSQ